MASGRWDIHSGTLRTVSMRDHGAVYEYVGPPLTCQSLAALLDADGVADRAYSLYGAHKEDAIVTPPATKSGAPRMELLPVTND